MMILKKMIFIILLGFIPPMTNAESPDTRWRLIMGYKTLNIKNYTYTHNTHPYDWFLPDANKAGSAGSTHINRMLHFMVAGIGIEPRLSNNMTMQIDLGMIGVGGGDRRLVENEIRPDNGYYRPTFIYSNAGIGSFMAANLVYYCDKFYFGIENQLNLLYIENGWDRTASYNILNDEFEKAGYKPLFVPTTGLKVGIGEVNYHSKYTVSFEGIIQMGKGISFGIQMLINIYGDR